MDWQLLGLTLLFATPGLLGGLVGLLGFTRAEKTLGAAYFCGFAILLVIVIFFSGADVSVLRTEADVDSWLAQMKAVHRAAGGMIWFCISVATAFCVVALMHLWRERVTLWKKLRVQTKDTLDA